MSAPQYGLVGPRAQKTLLLSCDSLDALSSIVCNLHGNELWLLERKEGSDPRHVRSFDLNSSGCAAISSLEFGSAPVSEGSHPVLEEHNSFVAGEHPLQGFVILSEERRPWQSGFDYFEPYPILVFVDGNKDGVVDNITGVSYTDYYSDHPLHEWNFEYH